MFNHISTTIRSAFALETKVFVLKLWLNIKNQQIDWGYS